MVQSKLIWQWFNCPPISAVVAGCTLCFQFTRLDQLLALSDKLTKSIYGKENHIIMDKISICDDDQLCAFLKLAEEMKLKGSTEGTEIDFLSSREQTLHCNWSLTRVSIFGPMRALCVTWQTTQGGTTKIWIWEVEGGNYTMTYKEKVQGEKSTMKL